MSLTSCKINDIMLLCTTLLDAVRTFADKQLWNIKFSISKKPFTWNIIFLFVISISTSMS